MKHIYLDHSATTPVDKRVLKEMLPYFEKNFGNASSIHTPGQIAMAGVDKARERVASFLNCKTSEVIFTSGATESNNLVIKGLIGYLMDRGLKNPHIITSSIEHDAVLAPCKELEKKGVEVTYLPVKSNGVVDLEKLKDTIKDNTVLVSIMYVNNEVGSVQPVREIGKIIKKINDKKLNDWKKIGGKKNGEAPQMIYFHTDATQAPSFFNCDVEWNYVDMLSMSGHKIYGPKGVGALYLKSGIKLKPIQLGGHQEKNIRSGTLNVPGIVGLGKAVSLVNKKDIKNSTCVNWLGENKKIAKLRDVLVDGLEKNIPNIVLNTDRENSTPNHAHFSFVGAEGESILISLDLAGIAVSTGSACASGSLEPSHVLLAMGIKKEIAHHSIRFTLGKNTTIEEIKKTIKILPPIIEKLRKMSPVI